MQNPPPSAYERARGAIHVVGAARAPRLDLPRPGNVLPQEGQTLSSYWTTITALIFVMMVLYLAANGLLARWLKLFIYATPQSVQPAGSSTSGSYAGSIAQTLGIQLPANNPAPTPGDILRNYLYGGTSK